MRLWKDRDGAVLVEAALVIPVALIIAFGGFEVGRAIVYQHTIDTRLREAARYIARMPIDVANDELRAQNLVQYGVWADARGGNPDLLRPGTNIDISLTFPGLDAAADPLIEIEATGATFQLVRVRLEATADYSFFLFPIAGINPNRRIEVSHEQPHIGA